MENKQDKSETENQAEKSSPDLSFFTRDELINELRKRSCAFVMILIPLEKDDHIMSRYHGHRILTRGLIADLVDETRYVPVSAQGNQGNEGAA